MAKRIAVLHHALQQVGDCFETAMRMLGEAGGLTGLVDEGAHVVEEQKWVDIHDARGRKSATYGDSPSLRGFQRRRQVPHGPEFRFCGCHMYLDVKIMEKDATCRWNACLAAAVEVLLGREALCRGGYCDARP